MCPKVHHYPCAMSQGLFDATYCYVHSNILVSNPIIRLTKHDKRYTSQIDPMTDEKRIILFDKNDKQFIKKQQQTRNYHRMIDSQMEKTHVLSNQTAFMRKGKMVFLMY